MKTEKKYMCVLCNQVNIDIAQRDRSEDEIEMKV